MAAVGISSVASEDVFMVAAVGFSFDGPIEDVNTKVTKPFSLTSLSIKEPRPVGVRGKSPP